MALASFDFKKTAVTMNGVPLSGFIDGDAVTVEFNEDEWELVVGADGEATRVKKNRPDGRITIRLNNSSPLNKVLAGFKQLDDLTSLAPVAIFIRDNTLGNTISAAQAWLVKDPGITLGRDLGQKEWVYETGELIIDHGAGTPF